MKFLIGELGDETYGLVAAEAHRDSNGGESDFKGLCTSIYDPTERPFLGGKTNLVVEEINEPIAYNELGVVNGDETSASLETFVGTVREMVNERNEVELKIIPRDERLSPVHKKYNNGKGSKKWHYCKARVDGDDCDKFARSGLKFCGMCGRHKTLFDEREVSTLTPNSDESESEGEEDHELADEESEKENDEMNSPKKKARR